MRVAELMTTDVVSIESDATVAEAVGRLADEHISALAVTTTNGLFVGVLSTSDILQAEASTQDSEARDMLFERTLVAEIMTREPLTIEPEAEAREAAQQMLYADVHRLFVTSQGKLVGVISQSDLVRALAHGRV
ncbi:MAG TPA: CBS domain-containing protein [Gemmatimonadales bacterium]|nr:CBS domain-containing protein [Gemmatimonadales bacterium]